jgi:hypothetical protein
VLVAIILFGCESNKSETHVNELKEGEVVVFTVDNCEYVIWDGYKCGGIIHKQNCKFCIKRNKKI